MLLSSSRLHLLSQLNASGLWHTHFESYSNFPQCSRIFPFCELGQEDSKSLESFLKSLSDGHDLRLFSLRAILWFFLLVSFDFFAGSDCEDHEDEKANNKRRSSD